MKVKSHVPVYVFAEFRLDPIRRLLMHRDAPVALNPKAAALLVMLVENRHRVLSKTELLDSIWESQFVEENNLAVQISSLRKVLGEKLREHRFIMTVPGQGYRFVADVSLEGDGNASPAPTIGSGPATNPKGVRVGSNRHVYRYALAILIILGGATFFWLNWKQSAKKQLKLTKLTASGKVVNATISFDEKFVVFAEKEPDGESLWLRQVETGGQTQIVPPQPLEYVGLTISPDSNFIYYSSFEANAAATPLKRIPLLGGAPQNVGDIESGVSVSFSPDGKRFAFTEGSSSLHESYLKTADADGQNPQVLIQAGADGRVIEDYKSNPVAWSPDGTEIAVALSENSKGGGKQVGIVLADVAGKERRLVDPKFASIHSVAWVDAENLALVAGEHAASECQLWMVGRASGELKRITNDLQDYLWLSAGRHGRLLTIQKNTLSSIQSADFAEIPETLEPRELFHEADIDGIASAADGSILYTSTVSGTREIWKMPARQPQAQQVTIDANVMGDFAVSPKDDSLVFSSYRNGRNSLWLAAADGTKQRQLTDGEDAFPQFTPDGELIVFQRTTDDVPAIWAIATTGGSQPVQLTRMHSLRPAVSPDGSKTAFYFMDFENDGQWRGGLVSTETGEFLQRLTFPKAVSGRYFRWHPTGEFIGQIDNTGETANLLLLPMNAGVTRVIDGLGRGSVNSFVWSPDGRSLTFVLTLESTDVVSMTDY